MLVLLSMIKFFFKFSGCHARQYCCQACCHCSWRLQGRVAKQKALSKRQVRTALRTMEGDAKFESCAKGDQINVIEELDDGSDFLIRTNEGNGLLHPDAFTEM